MKQRIFILASTAAGVGAFFVFRWFTCPLESALVWLLLAAFVGSSLVCSAIFSLLCQNIQQRWLRLISVPFFLAAFTFLSGLGVFAVTRLVYDSRPRSTDDGDTLYGAILYAATSGMQMLSLNSDLWWHVIVAVALPLLLLLVLSTAVAFTGLHRLQIKQDVT